MAAQDINMDLWNFLSGYKQYDKDHTIILTTGHSRGAAVANIVAGMYTNSAAYNKFARQSNVFAYTFACPSVSKDADESLLNIYNYNNCGDVIPALPLEAWGFKRFGRTITLQAKGIEYQNFLKRFKLQNGIDYAGMTDTSSWISTLRTLANTQEDFNTPVNQMLFGLVCAFLGPGQNEPWDLVDRVMADYIDSDNPEFYNGTFLQKSAMLLYEALKLKQTIKKSLWSLAGINSYYEDSELSDMLLKIDGYLNATGGMTEDEFKNYIGGCSLSDIEEEVGGTIKTRNDLMNARNYIYQESIEIHGMAPKIQTIINLFTAADTDPGNANSEGSISGLGRVLEHGHTGDTYILWINSLYYGFEGWKGTSVAPESLPDNITTLGYNCFRENTALESISIPYGVEYISSYDFCRCTKLKSVVIPDNVREIGAYAFDRCTGLESVTYPCDVATYHTYGGNYCPCFQDVNNITSIHYTYGKTGIMHNKDSYELYKISLEYKARESLTSVSFDDEITQISNYAFWNNTALYDVKLPSKLKSIGQYAFQYCGIKKIDIPDEVISIGSDCFSSSGLEEIKIPKKLSSISYGCFSYCKGLKEIVIPDNVREIEAYAFNRCTGLESVTYPCDVATYHTYGGNYCPCFQDVNNITSIHYTYGKTGIMHNKDSYELYKISLEYKARESLTSVSFDDEITQISNYAFWNNTALYDVKLPSKLKSIGQYAFAGIGSLKEIELPEGLESIGNSCFWGSGLEKLVLPSSLTTVPSSMCNGCKSLAELSIPSSVTTIGNYAFHDCDNLNDVNYDGYKEDWDKIDIGEYNEPLEKVKCKVAPCVHQYKSKVTKAATCTASGVRTYTCSKCGDTYTKKISALGHKWGEPSYKWSSDYKRCTATMICANDKSHKQTETVNSTCKLVKALTCAAAGSEKYIAVFNNKSFTAQSKTLMIPKPAHKYSVWKTTKKATCTADGTKTRTCSVCKKTETATIAKLGHDYTATVVKPTCTAKGYTLHKCTRCGDSYKDTYKDATGHSWSKWTTTKAATCTADGSKTRTCSVCKKTETAVIAKLGHDYKATVVKPTCTAKGYTLHKCSRCSDSYKDNYKDAAGHKFSDWKTTGYNFNKNTSSQTRTCAVCGKNEKQTVQNAINRLAGANRFDSAAVISKAMYPKTSDTVVVATGITFNDALVAVPLASAYNAPLLLATEKHITAQTEAELKRLKAKKVIVVSTNGAIGSGAKAELKALGLRATYIEGKNVFETSTKVAKALQTQNKKTPDTIFFATDGAFADALSASPVAAIKGAPIIYLNNKSIDKTVAEYLKSVKGSVKNAYIIGGNGVISDAMMKNVAKVLGLTSGKTVQRVAGANRYETCVAVNKKFKSVLNSDGICVAKGLDFPDALAGGVYAAATKQALFLADGKKLQDCQNSYLKSKNAGKITIFGGTGAVPDELVKLIAKANV